MSYIDITKVDRYVAHVVTTIHLCFKCMLRVFYLDVVKVDKDVAYTCMLQAYVSSILGVSYVCSTIFYLDVTYVSNGF
jgi:hypothetical protein